MKRPKWTDKTPTYVCHPAQTLKEAAARLDLDATYARKHGLQKEAREANYLAECLRRVAAGKTWAEAFDWPEITTKKPT